MTCRLSDKSGYVTSRALFWVFVLASVLYTGYKFAPPWAAFYMLKTEVEDEARNAHMYADETLARRILMKAQTWDVPIERDDIEIVRGRDFINITIRYSITMDFFGQYTKVQQFNIEVDEPLKESSGVLR